MREVYQIITDRIISQLENGTVPWHKPWNGNEGHPKSLVTGKNYRGINVFILHSASYESPYWLSYKQAVDRGGNVKKGEHGFPCVFWNWYEKENQKNGEKDKIPFLRYYTVFNVEQCENIPYPKLERKENTHSLDDCDAIVHRMPLPPKIEHTGDRACYNPLHDAVAMPLRESFDNLEDYYSVLFHELTHSTGHKTRLDRPGIVEAIVFGSKNYAKEELVAEMGAAFLCGHAGIEKKTFNNSASYIRSWLMALENDNRMVVHAAAQAQKATDYILGEKGEE